MPPKKKKPEIKGKKKRKRKRKKSEISNQKTKKKKRWSKTNVLFIRNGRKKKGKSRNKKTKSWWWHFCHSPTIGMKKLVSSSFRRGRLLWVWVENAWILLKLFLYFFLLNNIYSYFLSYFSSILFYLQPNTPLAILLRLRFYPNVELPKLFGNNYDILSVSLMIVR